MIVVGRVLPPDASAKRLAQGLAPPSPSFVEPAPEPCESLVAHVAMLEMLKRLDHPVGMTELRAMVSEPVLGVGEPGLSA